MDRLTLPQKVTIIFAVIVLLFIFSGYYAVSQLTALENARARLTFVDGQRNLVLKEIASFSSGRGSLPPFANNEDLNGYLTVSNDRIANLTRLYDEIEAVLTFNNQSGNQQYLSDLSQTKDRLIAEIGLTQNLAASEDWEGVRLKLTNGLLAEEEALSLSLRSFDGLLETSRDELAAELTAAQEQSLFNIGLVFGIAILSVIALGYATSLQNNSVEPAKIPWVAQDTEADLPGVDPVDELLIQPALEKDDADIISFLERGGVEISRVGDGASGGVNPNQLEIFRSLSQKLAQDLKFDAMLQQLADLVTDRFNLYHAGFYLLNRLNDQLELKASSFMTANSSLPINEKSVVGAAAYTKETILIRNVSEDPRYHHWVKLPETKSQLCIPLLVSGEILGVLDLRSASVDQLTEDGIPLYEALADFVSVSIYKSTLLEDELWNRQIAEKYQEINEIVSDPLEFDASYPLTLEKLSELVPFDLAYVLFGSGDQFDVKGRFVKGHLTSPSFVDKVPDILNDVDQILVQASIEGKPLTIANIGVSNMPNYLSFLLLDGGWLVLPLMYASDIRGLLSFARKEPGPFKVREIQVLQKYADQIAFSHEKANIFAQLKRFNEQLEYEVVKRTAAIEGAYAELERLDQTKSNFVDIASHELRTPLAIIRGYGEVLQNDPRLINNPHYISIIGGILNGVSRISDVVENLLDMSKIDYRRLDILPKTGFLQDAIQILLDEYREPLDDRNLQIVVDETVLDLGEVDFDLDAMTKVFRHVLVNGIKFTPDGGVIRIEAEEWTENPRVLDWPTAGVHLTFSDTGIGIDRDELEVIFNKFYQMSNPETHSSGSTKFMAGGTGLGLAIVRGIVSAHRGQVWAESDGSGNGSTFHIVLPKRFDRIMGLDQLAEEPIQTVGIFLEDFA